MSKAYIIEVYNKTAGIVTGNERGFRFFSSDRAFDRLEGHEFRTARDAERAAKALLGATKRNSSREALRAESNRDF
jgi:hypothetical protein